MISRFDWNNVYVFSRIWWLYKNNNFVESKRVDSEFIGFWDAAYCNGIYGLLCLQSRVENIEK